MKTGVWWTERVSTPSRRTGIRAELEVLKNRLHM